jgi:single-stranded-DNA-specific exonuclease
VCRARRSDVRRRWFINRTNPEFVDHLSKAASISPVLARLLINRGIKTASAANDFLTPGAAGLSDPFELPGMKSAVERIWTAVTRNEKVLVHGDYDTDGLTATVIMVQALRTSGLDVSHFIPSRAIHGYGFNAAVVGDAREKGIKLIITVDCGITSFDAAAAAGREGIDVIITDHHEPAARSSNEGGADSRVFAVPEAVAVVNPKLLPDGSGLEILSGAGISFKVAQALAADGRFSFLPDDALSLIDLAALGTLADVVPLRGENRSILQEGMRRLHATERPGVRALKDVCGLNKKTLKAGLLAFTMVPRMNAAGRIADAGDVVRLLLSDDYEEAAGLSAWLDRLNAERQRIEEEVYQHALSKLDEAGTDAAIVLSSEGWHEGVLGIVASRLAEKFYRPVFVFTVEKGVAKGSARSIPAFDICGGLAGCRELLLSYGGHKQAAGVRMKAENIGNFAEAIKGIALRSFNGDDPVPTLQIDADIELRQITHSLVRELEMLEPFGCGNAEPLFGAKGLEIVAPRTVGNNHLKMRLRKGSQTIDAIGFGMGLLFESLGCPDRIDAAFVPSFNEWNGTRHLQLMLRDIRPGG